MKNQTKSKAVIGITTVMVYLLTISLSAFAQLEPNTTTAPASSELVDLSPKAIETIGLKVVEIKRVALPREITSLGTIEAMPTKTYVQHALLGGRVTDTKVELGEKVVKGQVLAILDSPEINRLAAEALNTKNALDAEILRTKTDYATDRQSAQARLELAQSTNDRLVKLHDEKIAALKSLETSRADLEVAKNRLENISRKEKVDLDALEIKRKVTMKSLTDRLIQLGVPKSELENMMRSHGSVLAVPVTATRGGVVTDVHANPGETINGEDPLFDILDYSIVWAQAEIYEGDMDRVKPGQRVFVKANALPHERFQGTISHVGSEVDPKKHTLPVRVEVPNADLRLKPDMFVELYIQTEEPSLTIKLSRDAVVERSGHYGVFVQVKEGTYQLHRVTLGRSFGDDVEILSGIASGQKVVTRGAFQLEAHLLKSQGSTEVFSHPTESADHHEHEGEDAHDEKKGADANNTNQLLGVFVVLAFIFGIGVAAIFMRGGRKATSSTVQTGETQEKSHKT